MQLLTKKTPAGRLRKNLFVRVADWIGLIINNFVVAPGFQFLVVPIMSCGRKNSLFPGKIQNK